MNDQEVYAKEIADALEADLQPLATSGLVTRISKYDTNPANNLSRRSAPASGASALIRESQTTHAPASLAARRVSVKRSGMTSAPV